MENEQETVLNIHSMNLGTKSYRTGTVPYASLSYCHTWKKDIPWMKVEELDKVEHRGILLNNAFFCTLIE